MIHSQGSQFIRKKYKPKYQHSSLIGYTGFCRRCGSEKRLYMANNNGDMRDTIAGGLSLLNAHNDHRHRDCINCVTRSHMDNTIVYVKPLPKEKVQKDLDCLLENGIDRIDMKKGKDDMVFQAKEEREYNEFATEQSEKMEWWNKKKNI